MEDIKILINKMKPDIIKAVIHYSLHGSKQDLKIISEYISDDDFKKYFIEYVKDGCKIISNE